MSEYFNKHKLNELKQLIIKEYKRNGVSIETAEKMAIENPRFILAQEILSVIDEKAYLLIAFQELGKRQLEIHKDNLPARSAVIGAVRRYKKLRENCKPIGDLDEKVKNLGKSVKIHAEQFPYLSQIMNTLTEAGLPNDVIKGMYIQKGEESAKSYYKISDMCDMLVSEIAQQQGNVHLEKYKSRRQTTFMERVQKGINGVFGSKRKQQHRIKTDERKRTEREM